MDSQVTCYFDRSIGKYLISLLCLWPLLHRLHDDITITMLYPRAMVMGDRLFKRYCSSSRAKPSASVSVCDINSGCMRIKEGSSIFWLLILMSAIRHEHGNDFSVS